MAATTTTRRHQPGHNGPTGKASSKMASSNSTTITTASSSLSSSKTFSSKTSTTTATNGSIRPQDPRLSLSLRAFHQIAPRKRPRQEAFSPHGDIFSLLAAAAAAQQTSEPPQSQSADTSLPSPPQEKLEPSIFPASCLYDPVSPWGVRGIAYDPALPQWSLPDGVASPPCPSYAYEFVAGQSASASAPPPWTQHKTLRKLEQPKKERFFGPGLREVLNMIPSMPSPPILPPSRPAAAATDNNGYLTDKRVVLADVVPGTRQQTPQQTPATLATPITPVTPASAPALTATTANGKRRRKPSMKTQLLSENGTSNGRPVISTPASVAAPITPHATPIPPPVTPITPPVNGRAAPTTKTNGHGSRCCPMEVPTILHMILDQTSDSLKPQMIDSYVSYVPRLCHDHRAKYEHFKALMQSGRSSASASTTSHTSSSQTSHTPASSVLPPSAPPKKKRKSSANVATPTPSQQPALPPPPTHPPYTADPHGIRPAIKAARDDQYRRHMLAEIQQRLTTKHGSDTTHGGVTNRVIQSLLNIARHPNSDPSKGPLDVHALTGDEARTMLDSGSPHEPVITEKEQMFKWRPQLRPIAELFRRMENLDRRVSVQVPSRHCMDDSFESRDLIQVRDRFLGPSGSDDKKIPADDDPWNILDLRSPLPAAVLPQFLTNENCQLLPRLRDEVLNPSRAERDTAAREQWNEWRDVLEWVLLSQGGHNTSPHTDSHGLGTWITVQEGLFGFGWLSHPTSDERAAWMANPHGFRGGNWCYMVLEPGQTVFFNSGTVHFVFRLRSEPTLALGGHVLQWSGIERWLQVVAAQMQNPHITNEDMEWSAPKYVRVVARLVEARRQSGRVEEMGGASAVDRLLGLLKDFDDMYIKERPKPKGRPAKTTKTKGKKKTKKGM